MSNAPGEGLFEADLTDLPSSQLSSEFAVTAASLLTKAAAPAGAMEIGAGPIQDFIDDRCAT